jgi:hypothetical protein
MTSNPAGTATARELRRIADVLDANPDLPMPVVHINWHCMPDRDVKAILTAFPGGWRSGTQGGSEWAEWKVREPHLDLRLEFAVFTTHARSMLSGPSAHVDKLIQEVQS